MRSESSAYLYPLSFAIFWWVGRGRVCEFVRAVAKAINYPVNCNLRRRMLATRMIGKTRRLYYSLINRLALYRKLRWTATLALVAAYIQTAQASYDIATYLIGFYLLQLLIGYFTPRGLEDSLEQPHDDQTDLYSFGEQISQQLEGEGQQERAGLEHDGDKPLARSLGEIEIWERASFAFVMGLVCTYSKMLQMDVFWPLLLVYFVVLACYTLQKILKTMEKHKYGLADFHKQPR